MEPAEIETGAARASLELLYHISRELAAALDLHAVLQRVLFLAAENTGAVNGSILVLNDSGQPMDSAILIGQQIYGHAPGQLQEIFERGLAGWAARHRTPALASDTRLDERWLRRPDDDGDRAEAKSALSAPILVQDRLVGVMTLVHSTPGFFVQDHLDLVKAIADQAGIAILNAQLYESQRAAHQRYRELFEDNIDPILVTAWDGAILEANHQAEITTGLGKQALKRLNIAGLHNIDEEKVGPNYELLASGETVTYGAFLKLEGRREIPVQVYARKIHTDGQPCVQWILRDITERKKLDNLREDLISMIYHDLRSPLANIVSSLDVVASTFSPEKDAGIRSLLNIAVRSTERIQRLTDSLLDINRLEAGQPVANCTPADLLSLAKDALDAVLPVAQSKNQKIAMDFAADLPVVAVDADMIRRVLTNLLENAIKFTPPEGKIRVGACREGGFVQVWVEDSGPGIPPTERVQIFEKFSRLNAKDGPRGLGLGLAYCRLAVAGHGGRIWVESEPGEGARFKFTLPLAGEV